MTARLIAAALGLLLLCGTGLAQAGPLTLPATPAAAARPGADSLGGSRATAATVPADSLKVVKRTHRYRRQVGLALAMMAFVAVMMTAAQSLNPD